MIRDTIKYALGATTVVSAMAAAYWAGQQSTLGEVASLRQDFEARLETMEVGHKALLAQASQNCAAQLVAEKASVELLLEREKASVAKCRSDTVLQQGAFQARLDRAISQERAQFERTKTDAVQAAESRVRSEMTSDARLAELQANSLAQMMAILKDPTVSDAIPDSYKPIVENAGLVLPEIDIENASKQLPPLPKLEDVRACVAAGQVIEMGVGQFVDQCESNAEIVMTRRYYAGPDPFIEIAINGQEQRLILGRRADIGGGCSMSLLRMTNADQENIAALRFKCD